MTRMVTIAKDKQGMREEARKARDAMSEADAREKSAGIAKLLLATREYAAAKTMLFYASKGNEVRTESIIKQALNDRKTVLLSITNVTAREIEISEIKSYDLKEGAYGIPEPKEKLGVAEETIELVIVPGLAFDKEGGRIGYGHGYYDKILKRLRNKNKALTAIALAYELQLVDKVAAKEHDQHMDAIVTENGVTRCRK